MEKTLMILEVAQKQNYIFSAKTLRENAARSGEIAYVTGPDFLKKAGGDDYQEQTLVYAGGGHAVLQFDDRETARRFAGKVTLTAARQFCGLELYAKIEPYRENETPQQNHDRLIRALEVKKSFKAASIRLSQIGVEATDPITLRPKRTLAEKPDSSFRPDSQLVPPPKGWEYPANFSELDPDDNFIAVVHIDGNAMGARSSRVNAGQTDWSVCCERWKKFSEAIQRDFEAAFAETAEIIARYADAKEKSDGNIPQTSEDRKLPLRPVILAGDDVCFVCAGSIGLEAARIFLEKLSKKQDIDGTPYAACAGVAMVHVKYPFHQTYDLAEALCLSAKKYGASLDPSGRVSALDCHIDFGQLRASLHEQREDYRTDDDQLLSLRPVAVITPDGVPVVPSEYRTYAFFRRTCAGVKGFAGKVARSKLKELRGALKQGSVETKFFMNEREIADSFGSLVRSEPFLTVDPPDKDGKTKERCLLFDSIELSDHFTVIEEETV